MPTEEQISQYTLKSTSIRAGRPREKFTLYPRRTAKLKKGKPVFVWYFQVTDSRGNRSTGKSTGLTSKTAARNYVMELYREGIVSDDGLIDRKKLNPQKLDPVDQKFREYAENWWIYDRCEYIQRKLAKRKRISRQYADVRRGYLERHVLPVLGPKKLRSITPDDIEKLLYDLLHKEGRYGILISSMTVNQVLSTLRIMFAYAVKTKRILKTDPTEPVDRFGEERRERGFLTVPEMREILDEDRIDELWGGNVKHYAINLLAAQWVRPLPRRCI